MVKELRLALTVENFDEALAFYRDTLGLELRDMWVAEGARGALLNAGRATLELFDEGQAAMVDEIEVGRRVAGTVRLAFEV
ncbi:MAG: VOC family protein, partial [Gaiellaceae bacterium]